MKEYINHLEEALSSEKSKYDFLEKDLKRKDEKIKSGQDKIKELEAKLIIDKDRIEELENDLKLKDKELKQIRSDDKAEEGGSSLGPESLKANMKDKIKQLEKENAILKQELENKFDKEKAMMQSKLQDTLREKEKL